MSLPEGWQEIALGKVCDKIQDGAHRSPKTTYGEPGPGRFPYVTSKNIRTGYMKLDTLQYCESDFHDEIWRRCNPELGDVLLTKDGANTGNVCLNTLNEPFSTLSSVCLLKPKRSELDPSFLFYYLQSEEGQARITGQMTGTAIKRIILKTIKKSPIPLPALSEQRRIVSVLDAAFAGLATATANTQKNLQNARELFERELESIYQRVNAKADIPKRQLSELMKIGSSKRIMETDWTPDGVPFYGGKEIVELAKNGTTTSRNYISKEKYDEYAQQYDMPSRGDILFTARGTIGTGYIVQEGDKFYYKDGNIISMRPMGEINPSFVLYAFATNVIKHQLESLSGTTVKHLPLNKAKKLMLPVPSIKEQAALVENIENLQAAGDSLTDLVERKLAALSELKQSLLHRAFRGELSGDASGANSGGQAAEQLSEASA